MVIATLTGALIWGALAAVSAVSLVLRHPWTALLSARRYPAQVRAHPLYQEANMIITAAWTAYYALAAVTTAVTVPIAGLLWIVPTPLLGWLSFKAGDRYAIRRVGPMHSAGGTMDVIDEQRQLRRQISRMSDQDILEFAQQQPGGVEALVDLTVNGMPGVLDPPAAEDCVIGYEISVPAGTLAYRIEVKAGQATVEHRDPDDARVILQLTAADYLRLICGLIDGTEAFMSGKMRIRGDVMFAPRVGVMFRTP
jgi:hypothetical protein